MKIDRHNYEEFFVLYIDNELTVDQRKQVDLFVKENPDLQEELVMLRQSKLVPDHSVVFEKKEFLMKEEYNSFINMNNYEEWLVLYVDDELNDEEREAVEKFAANYPKVREELILFRQTKLQQEAVTFNDKESLYRNEKVRVISVQWWKVAAAAILIIAASISFYFILNNNNNRNGNNGVAKTKINSTPNSPKPLSPEVKIALPANRDESISPKEEDRMVIARPNQKKSVRQIVDKSTKSNQEPTANTAKPNERISQHAIDEISEKNTEQPEVRTALAPHDKMVKQIFSSIPVTNPTVETPDKSTTSNNDVQYASNNTENKRLRGFFRKATRLIERTTNINPANDDNKVLIGGMAINLK